MSTVSELQSQINSLQSNIRQAQQAYEVAVAQNNNSAAANQQEALQLFQTQLASLQSQLSVAQAAEANAGGATSTGEVAQQAGQTQPVPIIPESQVNQSTDVGTNADTRTLQKTQATPQPAPQPFSRDEDGNPFPPVSAGRGSANDDNSNGANTRSGTSTVLNTAQTGRVTPQDNILDRYASYTYALSLYLITPQQFADLAKGPPNFSTWLLLMQDGGAAANVYSGNGKGGRSPYFPLDFYMDNLTLTSQMPLCGSLSAHNVTDLEFKIYEPSGLTLPNLLAEAVKDFYKQTGVSSNGKDVNYNLAHYVMVIRFYGYDENGNLVDVGNTNQAAGTSTPGINNAVVTKYYPFAMKKLDFRLGSKGVEYTIHGAPYIYMLNASAKRGSIPQQFNLVGTTVGDILNGTGAGGRTVVQDDGRTPVSSVPKPAPQGTATPAVIPQTLSSKVTGQDNPLATSGGMDFTAGNF